MTASTATKVFGILAGLFGACGAALAAAASHGADPRLPGIAAAMLLVHAPALLALAASEGLAPRAFRLAGAALALGVSLFSADLAARHFLDDRLFPGAAPIGGALVILGWLAVSLGFLLASRR